MLKVARWGPYWFMDGFWSNILRMVKGENFYFVQDQIEPTGGEQPHKFKK